MTRLTSWTEWLESGQSKPRWRVDRFSSSQAMLFDAADSAAPSDRTASAVGASPLLTRRTRSLVERLLAVVDLPKETAAARWFLHQWGPRWIDAAVIWATRIDSLAQPEIEQRLFRLLRLAESDESTIFDPPRLLDGSEVQRLLGLRPGPLVGEALEALRKGQIEGHVTTTDEAKGFLARWKRQTTSTGEWD